MKYFCCSLLSCFFLQGHTQNYFDISTLSYINTIPNDFEITNAQTKVEELALELNFPIIINEKTVLLNGVAANKTRVGLDTNMPSSTLNVLGLNFGINKTSDNTWSGTFMAFSKVASDKIKPSNDNLQFGFLTLITNKKLADLKYRYGI